MNRTLLAARRHEAQLRAELAEASMWAEAARDHEDWVAALREIAYLDLFLAHVAAVRRELETEG